jgi:hypothetical protein
MILPSLVVAMFIAYQIQYFTLNTKLGVKPSDGASGSSGCADS